jgi:hypothetical protein
MEGCIRWEPGHAYRLAPQRVQECSDGNVTSGTKQDRQRIVDRPKSSGGAPNKSSLAAYRDGQAWLESTCRYKSVTDGGQQSLLAVIGAEISVSSALTTSMVVLIWTTLERPLESNIAQFLDRQSAPSHLPYHCRGTVTPVHCAGAHSQVLTNVASLGSATCRS